MTLRHPLIVLSAALFFTTACEPSVDRTPAVSAPPEATPIAGMYEVSGTTVEEGTGAERDISGSVILSVEGASYTATFHLNTTFEGEDGVLPTEVIGKGAGTIDGRELRGDAETQLVISSVPGIDPAFAFIPRTTTTRLASKSVTSIANDGSVEITIENQGAAGEAYRPTRTTLRGVRTAAPRVAAGELPPVAAPPPDEDE